MFRTCYHNPPQLSSTEDAAFSAKKAKTTFTASAFLNLCFSPGGAKQNKSYDIPAVRAIIGLPPCSDSAMTMWTSVIFDKHNNARRK